MSWQPDYLTEDEAKGYLKIPLTDTEDDAELATAITTASREVDDHTNRQFGQVAGATTFYYTARYDYDTGLWRADIDDLPNTTSLVVTVDGTTISSAGYSLKPRNAVAKGKVWTLLVWTRDAEAQPCGKDDEVAITSPSWGWPSIPAAIKHGTKIQLERVHWRRGAPAGVAGSPEAGSEIRLLAKLDVDAAFAVRHYVRSRGPR